MLVPTLYLILSRLFSITPFQLDLVKSYKDGRLHMNSPSLVTF